MLYGMKTFLNDLSVFIYLVNINRNCILLEEIRPSKNPEYFQNRTYLKILILIGLVSYYSLNTLTIFFINIYPLFVSNIHNS